MAEHPTLEEIAVAVGRLARRLREEAGMDLEEVAKRTKWLSPAEIDTIEQGANPDPELVDLMILAATLDVEPRVLLEVARWEPSTSEDDSGRYVWVNPPSDDLPNRE